MALNPLDRIAREVAEVKRQLAGRSQLNHSSLENTAIPVYDEEGTERLRIGAQDDGTHAVQYVQGPPPARPTIPVVSVDGPVVRVRWDGILMGGHIPADFARIDVHFALASDDLEDSSAVRGNLATAAGSEVTLMATQTGTYRVGLVAMSQSRARSEMSETVEVEVQVVDLATAIETATQSANGKNTVVLSERSPEPTDEGAEGDTWWVNEIRPRDPEDPASGAVIAIIEQWQHAGGVWVQVELAHEVIASVDLGRASVGYLHGGRIEAGTIDTPQLAFGAATGAILAADALHFKEAYGMTFRGGAIYLGDTLELLEDYGIRQFGPDGALNVNLPSDGSEAQFRGDLSARTLTATGRMAIQGPGAIAAGGVLELESGVVPPVAGPQLTPTWDRVMFPALDSKEQATGIAWAGGHWWRAVTGPTRQIEGQYRNCRVEKIHPGAPETVVSQFWSKNNGQFGMTAIGDELFIFGKSVMPAVGAPPTVEVYGSDGVWKRSWSDTAYQDTGFQPGIGSDGTSLIRAQCGVTGILYLNYYNRTTGVQSSTTTTGDVFNADVGGVHVGATDFGTTHIVVAKKVARGATGLRQMIVFNAAAPYAYRPDLAWYGAGFDAPVGMVWDGARFHTLHQDGSLHMYEPLMAGQFVGDDDSDWWGAVAWASADGTQVTPVGPATQFRYLKRSIIRRQNGDVPEGVERARFYVAKKSSEPTRTDLHYISYSEVPRNPSRILSIPSDWATYARPREVNSFETGSPGEVRSSIGTFRVDGTGAGEWGPLAFHPDGTMTGIPAVAGGRASLMAGGSVLVSATVTLPSGRFTTAPAITVTPRTGGVATITGIGVENETPTSFKLGVYRTGGTYNTEFQWIAVERG